MPDRHLLPEELELLVDGEDGSAVVPLRAHLEACAECQGRLSVERQLIALLEHAPHFAPAPGFADRVMREVRVFEPWHVALTDSLRRLVPPPGPWRGLATAGLGGVALSLSVLAMWALLRLDTLLFLLDIGVDRLQQVMVQGVGAVVTLAFGETAAALLPTGGAWGAFLAIIALLGSVGVAALGFRGLLATVRRGER
jgi:hypothetical protein